MTPNKNNTSELEKLASLGRLSATVFHDMANALTSLSLANHELQHADLKPQQSPLVTRINTACEKLLQMFGQIQKYQKHNGVDSHFGINTEIGEAIALLEYKRKQAQVEIICNTSTDITLFGNKIGFFQVMVNLISNAIDSFSDVEDRVKTITIHVESLPHIVQIQVQDNGQGIPSHILTDIFKPLFTTKPVSEGTGFGLSHTKEIIEKEFNGLLVVHSTWNEGTVFTISIPL